MKQILVSEAWILRSQKSGRRDVYFESHAVWTTNPRMATIFRDYEMPRRNYAAAASSRTTGPRSSTS